MLQIANLIEMIVELVLLMDVKNVIKAVNAKNVMKNISWMKIHARIVGIDVK